MFCGKSLRKCEYSISLKNNCIVSSFVLQNSLVHGVHFTLTIQITYIISSLLFPRSTQSVRMNYSSSVVKVKVLDLNAIVSW
jgi:hypothetical protein